MCDKLATYHTNVWTLHIYVRYLLEIIQSCNFNGKIYAVQILFKVFSGLPSAAVYLFFNLVHWLKLHFSFNSNLDLGKAWMEQRLILSGMEFADLEIAIFWKKKYVRDVKKWGTPLFWWWSRTIGSHIMASHCQLSKPIQNCPFTHVAQSLHWLGVRLHQFWAKCFQDDPKGWIESGQSS